MYFDWQLGLKHPNNNYSFRLAEEIRMTRNLIPCNWQYLWPYLLKTFQSLCLQSQIMLDFKLCATVKEEKQDTGFQGGGKKKKKVEEGAPCQPACTTKEKQSQVIACHQTDNSDLKCRVEGGDGSAYCKPVKDVWTIHLRRDLTTNHTEGRWPLGMVTDDFVRHEAPWTLRR